MLFLYSQFMCRFDLCLSKLCKPKPILSSALAVLALGLERKARKSLAMPGLNEKYGYEIIIHTMQDSGVKGKRDPH